MDLIVKFHIEVMHIVRTLQSVRLLFNGPWVGGYFDPLESRRELRENDFRSARFIDL